MRTAACSPTTSTPGRPITPCHGRPAPLARLALVVGLSLAGATAASAVGASAAGAQTLPTPVTVSTAEAEATPTTQGQGAPTPNIIPEPNRGQGPRDPGDRGGWWQEALFFGMCGAMVLMAGLVWRDSRKQRRRQGRPLSRAARHGAREPAQPGGAPLSSRT